MHEEDRNGKTVYGKKGSYSNLSFLGAGGFKIAYNATDDQHGNKVVVVFPTTIVNGVLQNPSYHNQVLKSLGDEMRMLKNITITKQPHSIIRFIDESKNGSGFFILEKGGDSDIQKKCRQNPLSQIEIIKIATDVLHGLNFLHTQQPSIIHRDIKCDNIFINGTTGNILIGDFGLAKKMEDSITTTILGTPQFMAPEIYKEKYDERIDIYSFGMTLIEIVTQSTPYAECETIPKIWQKVLNGQKPEIVKKIKHKKLKHIIEKCISKSSTRITIDELINNEFLNNDEDNDLDDFLYPFKELKNGDEKILKTKQKILLNAEKEAKKIIKKAKQKANKIIKQAKQKTSNSQNTIKTQTSSDEEKQKNIDQLIQQSIKELIPKEQTIII